MSLGTKKDKKVQEKWLDGSCFLFVFYSIASFLSWKYVVLRHLFKSFETDMDSFTVQVH